MPRPLIRIGVILVVLSLLPLAWLAVARTAPQTTPRIQVVYDMDSQRKPRAQAASDFFADGRAMRKHVEGTMARGELVADVATATGKSGDEWLLEFPVALDASRLARGRERFDIYCAPCHGIAGRGDGLVHRRASALGEGTWTQPTDLTSDAVATQAVGQIYGTITNGIRNMPAYAVQLDSDERWAVAAYVRALQRSVRGGEADLSDDARASLR